MVHCGFGELSNPAAEEDGRACKQECTATRLNDPHPKGTEFQYMSLSCCMHSDTRSEGPQTGCQNQYLNYRYVRYTARAVRPVNEECSALAMGRWIISDLRAKTFCIVILSYR